jgi:glycosyltransferase involved in cell wall biosynthesis
MRILLVTQYFPPETGAAQNRLGDLATRLADCGHAVTVVTSVPNYPHGRIFDGYRGRWLTEERLGRVRVIRTWVYTSVTKGFVNRLANYFSFVLSSAIAGAFRVGRQDWIIVELPPLFLGLSGMVLRMLKRGRLLLNVSDLWPASAVALGVLRNGLLFRLSTQLELALYRHADAITGQTRGIVDDIRARCPDTPVALMTNGVDVRAFRDDSAGGGGEAFRKEIGLGDQFVVGYAGLHGLVYGLSTVLEAARLLRDVGDVVFVFVGDGPERERLRGAAHAARLTNVRFVPSQPASRMRAVWAAFDAALVPLRRERFFEGTLPSKMFEAMAAGLPIIASVQGEARAVIEAAGAGISVEPEDALGIADAVRRLRGDRAYRASLGNNGRRHVMEHYDRARIARSFESFLLSSEAT